MATHTARVTGSQGGSRSKRNKPFDLRGTQYISHTQTSACMVQYCKNELTQYHTQVSARGSERSGCMLRRRYICAPGLCTADCAPEQQGCGYQQRELPPCMERCGLHANVRARFTFALQGTALLCARVLHAMPSSLHACCAATKTNGSLCGGIDLCCIIMCHY